MLDIPYAYHQDPPRQAPEKIRDLVKRVTAAERLIVTTCEYNRAIPPALSNLIDYLSHASLAFKPTGIVSYSLGATGGIVASTQLRSLLAELGCVVVPCSVTIPSVGKQIEWPSCTADQSLLSNIDLVIEQVEYLSKAFQSYRTTTSVAPPKVQGYL
ncbi:unnamed protein product [Dicrocoelium dendriticum]|nr:unnamed protein product [Dicrocoelium dendriticum]